MHYLMFTCRRNQREVFVEVVHFLSGARLLRRPQFDRVCGDLELLQTSNGSRAEYHR